MKNLQSKLNLTNYDTKFYNYYVLMTSHKSIKKYNAPQNKGRCVKCWNFHKKMEIKDVKD